MKVLLALLVVLPCVAADSARPRCTAHNRGQLWPARANTDDASRRRAARCGELEICTLGTWKYGWRPLTVNVRRLGKRGAGREIPGCLPESAPPPPRLRTDRETEPSADK